MSLNAAMLETKDTRILGLPLSSFCLLESQCTDNAFLVGTRSRLTRFDSSVSQSVTASQLTSQDHLFCKCRKVVREIWFEKSGSRNLVREKWLTRKKNPSLKNHFSRTTFLHFSRKVVAD